MIRITLKGNPGLYIKREVIKMRLRLMFKAICEKILLLREETRGFWSVRRAVSTLTRLKRLLLAITGVCSKQALGGPQGWRSQRRSPGVHHAHTSACFDCEKSQFGLRTLHSLHPLGLEMRSTSTFPRRRKQKVCGC